LESFKSSGRIVIDLEAALAGDVVSDLPLEPGDSIFIPRLTNTIAIIGEVRRPGTQTFSELFTLEDYLDLSAGYTSRADKSGVFIVRVDGAVDQLSESNWLLFDGPQYALMPGDTIVVPVNYEYKESLATWRDVTQIIYQGMVSIAAIARL
jgi:polysaccharide export outer membrane protein